MAYLGGWTTSIKGAACCVAKMWYNYKGKVRVQDENANIIYNQVIIKINGCLYSCDRLILISKIVIRAAQKGNILKRKNKINFVNW